MNSGEHDAIRLLTDKVCKMAEVQAVQVALQTETRDQVKGLHCRMDDMEARAAKGSERFRNHAEKLKTLEEANAVRSRAQSDRLWQVLGWVAPLLVSGAMVAYAAFLTPSFDRTRSQPASGTSASP